LKCPEVERRQLIEKYLTGDLAEGEKERLEEHILTCESCHEELAELSLLRASLEEDRWAVADRRPERGLQWHWALAAVATLVFITVVLWPRLAGHPGLEDGVIARLSAVEAPPYEPRNLRAAVGEGERRFREAMVAYQQGDFGEAIPGLEAAVELEPELANARFYLGACLLLTDQPDKAIESLSLVAELDDPQYPEWAYFYRAKAHLQVGDLDSARDDLTEVVSLEGDLAAQAQEDLNRLTE